MIFLSNRELINYDDTNHCNSRESRRARCVYPNTKLAWDLFLLPTLYAEATE